MTLERFPASASFNNNILCVCVYLCDTDTLKKYLFNYWDLNQKVILP